MMIVRYLEIDEKWIAISKKDALELSLLKDKLSGQLSPMEDDGWGLEMDEFDKGKWLCVIQKIKDQFDGVERNITP